MRCPKCNQEINPHSERCPNCGTSAKYAVPDGDTMTRVRRQISVIRRENEVSDIDLSDASFSPVLKFDKPEETAAESQEEYNPANNFPDESFEPVDISRMIETEDDSEKKHRDLSASIRQLVNNKGDDLLAEYYFKDGITDLERYQLERSYEELEKEDNRNESKDEELSEKESQTNDPEMSEAAKRLSQFPDETGLDKVLTSMWEKYDSVVLKIKKFFRRNVIDRLLRHYNRFDSKTSGFTNGLLDKFYYKRFGGMKRKRAEDNGTAYYLRRRFWGGVFFLVVMVVISLIAAGIFTSSDINGKWIVSVDSGGNPNIIMEFKRGGRAAILVKSDDGWHVHKQGKYSTNRKNGHDMLTISYEDGDIKRLYYKIDGKTGTFINVDTNVQVVYQLK